jgi:hypothetical protein
MTDRIIWNRPPSSADGGSIDEIVVENCTVHIEQMDLGAFWISLRRPTGEEWQGNFVAQAGEITLSEQENTGLELNSRTHGS